MTTLDYYMSITAMIVGFTAVLVCGPYQVVLQLVMAGIDQGIFALADVFGPTWLFIGLYGGVIVFFVGISLIDL